MAWGILNLLRGGDFGSLGLVFCNALVDQRPHHCASLRPTHALPGHGRPGVQDHAVVHARDNVFGDTHAHQHRPALLDALAYFSMPISRALSVRPMARTMSGWPR